MPAEPNNVIDPAEAASHIARELEKRGVDYAIGGAIALGYWARPRGTVDVDITLFLPQERASEAIRILHQIGCDVNASRGIASLREHGFCRATYLSRRVDVFVECNDFYQHAKQRRRRVDLEGQPIMVLDAESLTVLKMLFFRPQDMLDIQNVLKMQRDKFDRAWVRERLVEIAGPKDARVIQWDELTNDLPA